MAAAVHKMLMWLDGPGWVTPFQISESPESNADPDGSASVPVIPGTQRMNVDGQWLYLTSPANLAMLIQAGSQVLPASQTPSTQTHSPTSVSLNPMAMMQQMLQQSMMVQMVQGMGLNLGNNEPKQPIDLSQLSGPAAVIGEKIKEAVLGGIQLWRAVKG